MVIHHEKGLGLECFMIFLVWTKPMMKIINNLISLMKVVLPLKGICESMIIVNDR